MSEKADIESDFEFSSGKIHYDSLIAAVEDHIPLVRSRVTLFLNSGIEYDDLMQEGMIGLLNAIKSFNTSKSSFTNFAVICIDRMLIDACRWQNRKGHIPSFLVVHSDKAETETEFQRIDCTSPESVVVARDNYKILMDHCRSELSKMEYAVFYNFLVGYKQSEISKKLNITVKSVDNTLQRIKRKLKKSAVFNMPL